MTVWRHQKTFPRPRCNHKRELGFSLIEILVALAILAAVAVVFLLGISTSSKAVMVSQESVALDSLAKSEVEYVKSNTYRSGVWEYELPGNPPSWDPARSLPDGYAGFSVHVSATPVHDPDDGVQTLTVSVARNGQTEYTMTALNAAR